MKQPASSKILLALLASILVTTTTLANPNQCREFYNPLDFSFGIKPGDFRDSLKVGGDWFPMSAFSMISPETNLKDMGLTKQHVSQWARGKKKVISIGEGLDNFAWSLRYSGVEAKAMDVWYGHSDLASVHPQYGPQMANYVEKNRSFLIAGDARKTGLADGSVDAVVIKDTVNHMSYENALKAVLETYRILENNEGRAYINVSKAHAKSLVSELNTRFGVRSAELRPDTSSSESLFGNKQVINLVLRKGDSKTKMDFDDSVSLDQGAQLVARQIRQATTEHLQRQRVLSMDARGYGFDAVYSSIISHLNTMPIGQRFDVINMTSSDATSLVQSIERRYGKGVQTSSTFEGLTNPQFSAWIANRNDLSFGVTQASTFQTLQDSAYRASQVPITVSIQRNW